MILTTQKRITALMIIAGIFLGLVVIETSTYLILNEIEGIRVSNTIFQNLSKSGKVPAFDMFGMESKNGSYFIDSNLWNFPLITSSQARSAAYEFLETNFNEDQLESISVQWQDLVGDQPTWVISIEGSHMETLIFVNAISGEVIGWNLSSLTLGAPESYHENESQISSSIAEECVFDFLALNNYSIPDNARYLGVNEYPSDLNNYYVIFRHYEGQFPVGIYPRDSSINPDHSYEGIILRIDKRTGAITQFGYHWLNIAPPPLSGIISEGEAKRVVEISNESENISIIDAQILITSIPSLVSSDGSPHIHLIWRVAINRDMKLVYVHIDAYTGNVIDELRTNSNAPTVINTPESSDPIVLVIASFSVGVIVAISSSIMIRKRYLS